MDDQERFLFFGTMFIVALMMGMALGNMWSSFVTNVNLSLFFM